jgi:hypothetical protein
MNMNEIKFSDKEHERLFYGLLKRMDNMDCYHQSLAYLLALDTVCRKHVGDLYDFAEQCVKANALEHGWQTGTSRKTTRLAFNLFTGHADWAQDEGAEYCTPAEIFCSEYAPYYWQAVKLRYPEYTEV